jgi:hypothetical protein
MYLPVLLPSHQWINTFLILLTNFAFLYLYLIRTKHSDLNLSDQSLGSNEAQTFVTHSPNLSFHNRYESHLIDSLFLNVNDNEDKKFTSSNDQATSNHLHHPRHWRKKSIRDTSERETNNMASVEFFPKPQPTPKTHGYIWLTSYSRVPVCYS